MNPRSARWIVPVSLLLFLSPVSALLGGESKPALPRLVDLGAGKCIPCKRMKPILEELGKTYSDQFEVVFIDVWEKKEEGSKHGIRMIPTQIFYAADGKELARHEGFMAKKDILAKWKQLGLALREPLPCPAK